MLENVSWVVFLKMLGICLAVYYAYVLIRYFRTDFSGFLVKGIRMEMAGKSDSRNRGSDFSAVEKVEALLSEIDRDIVSNARTTEELLELFRNKLLVYELPDSSAVRKILVSHMLLAAKAGQVELTEEDLLLQFSASQH